MQLQLVTVEQAKKLKKLGFDWKVYCFYLHEGYEPSEPILQYDHNIENFNKNEDDIQNDYYCYYFSAPSVAHALKWFRDVKDVDYSIIKHHSIKKYYYFGWTIHRPDQSCRAKASKSIATYEECESALLDALIEYTEGK